MHWRILSKLGEMLSCPKIIFLNETKDSGESYRAERRPNFMPV